MPVVLAPIAVVVLVLWVIAAALAISLIMAKIGDIFRGIPVVGGYIAGAVESVAQGIANVCGKLEHGIDGLIGASWHWMARYLDRTWHHMVADAHLGFRLAEAIGGHIYDLSGLRALVDALTKAWHGIEHGVKVLQREFHGIERRVKALERSIAEGIGHDLRVEIKALEHEVTKIDHKIIPAIRSEVATAEADVSALQKWVTDHALLVGTTALTGAVAWALSQLGLGGLRCPSFLRSLGNRGCGLWNGIEDLLGLFIDAVLLSHLCDLPKWIEELFSPLLGELTGLISSAASSLCAQANSHWAKLEVANGPLPPPQTLYLPDNFG